MSNELSEKLRLKLENGREYRALKLETRAEEESETMTVEGYATTFNEPYLLYAWEDYEVWEQVDARAFDETDMSDVILQYNHEGRVFARNKNGTLDILVDEHGLKVIAHLEGTDIGRELYQEIKGGYTDKMSFGFTVEADEVVETNENGKTTVLRTITKIGKLYDVSAVSIPANDMTEISARAYSDGAIAKAKAERLERARIYKAKINILMEA